MPNLKELIIGGVRVPISGVDVEDVRAVIAEADLASRRLLALLDTIRAHVPEPPPARPSPVPPPASGRMELRLAELESKVQAMAGGLLGGPATLAAARDALDERICSLLPLKHRCSFPAIQSSVP